MNREEKKGEYVRQKEPSKDRRAPPPRLPGAPLPAADGGCFASCPPPPRDGTEGAPAGRPALASPSRGEGEPRFWGYFYISW